MNGMLLLELLAVGLYLITVTHGVRYLHEHDESQQRKMRESDKALVGAITMASVLGIVTIVISKVIGTPLGTFLQAWIIYIAVIMILVIKDLRGRELWRRKTSSSGQPQQ